MNRALRFLAGFFLMTVVTATFVKIRWPAPEKSSSPMPA